MKTGSYVLVVSLLISLGMLCGANTASAWSDSMPHYGTSGACTGHMTNTVIGTAPATKTFYLCVANSQATSWSSSILKSNGDPLPSCGLVQQPVSTSNFTCSNIPKGYYRGYIYYWVPGNSFPHTESYYYIVQ